MAMIIYKISIAGSSPTRGAEKLSVSSLLGQFFKHNQDMEGTEIEASKQASNLKARQ